MELAFWQGFLVLSVLAALFILWPTLVVRRSRKSELQTDSRAEANEEVYQDQLKDLEATHADGEIGEEELEALKKDLERTHSSEMDAADAAAEKPIISNFRSRLPVMGLMLAVPLLALAIYSYVGAKPDWDIYQMTLTRAHAETMPDRKASNEELIKKLQLRLASKPDNVQNWYLLANVALELQDYDEGVRAYRKLLDLEPNAAKVIAELAQALFLRAGKTVTPEVREHTELALQLNPHLPTALGLAGIDAFQSGEYQKAINNWQKAVARLNPQSSAAQVLTNGITRAQLALEQSGGNKVANGENDDDSDNISIKVSVSIDKDKVDAKPEHQVFIYARAWQGPKMPLAIQKLTVADLPTKITLDKTMSMAPGMDLSSFPQVELVARISQAGSAIPASGDWQASAGPIILADHQGTVKLKISEQLP